MFLTNHPLQIAEQQQTGMDFPPRSLLNTYSQQPYKNKNPHYSSETYTQQVSTVTVK